MNIYWWERDCVRHACSTTLENEELGCHARKFNRINAWKKKVRFSISPTSLYKNWRDHKYHWNYMALNDALAESYNLGKSISEGKLSFLFIRLLQQFCNKSDV